MTKLLAKLLGLTQSVLAFYLPVLKAIAASGMAALLPVALDIVRSLAKADISGNEKFSLATNRLREAAVAQGIEASESIIRYTVESAVQKLKAGEA